MKKNNKNLNTKGFVMSELLAASIVILLLFSILFANYLPLTGEFETRIAYNNVTANYGAFYVRKVYKTVLEDSTAKATLDQGLVDKGYYTVYTSTKPNEIKLATNYEDDLANIIEKYQIEEIIITKYKTDEVKGRGTNLDKRYTRSSGVLYSYIKYLPYYTLSIYDGKSSEPYRLIMKTGYGYATTQILPDPPTPISCFDLKYIKEGEFTVTNYHEECGENVTITANEITVGMGSEARHGVITSITGTADNKGAFEGKGIKTINLSQRITDIGKNAFKNNFINKFSFENNAPGVTSVGDYAFSDNKFTRITIPGSITTIGEGAFANNYNLQVIEFDFEHATNPINIISKNMFSLSEYGSMNSSNLISLFIPANIQTIKENAFRNLQFSSIEFENNIETNEDEGEEVEISNPSQLETIEANAFRIDEQAPISPTNYIQLSLPNRIETIGAGAFQNVKLGRLIFQVDDSSYSALKTIGANAFNVYETNIANINTEDFCDTVPGEEGQPATCQYKRNLKIPTSVTRINANAFKNQELEAIVFDNINDQGIVVANSKLTHIEDGAFSGNKLETITIPPSLAVSDATVGTQIFGSSYTLGNNSGEIIIQNPDMFNKSWWCDALFGSTCTVERVDEEGVNDYKYTHNSTTKYISYQGEEEGEGE